MVDKLEWWQQEVINRTLKDFDKQMWDDLILTGEVRIDMKKLEESYRKHMFEVNNLPYEKNT